MKYVPPWVKHLSWRHKRLYMYGYPKELWNILDKESLPGMQPITRPNGAEITANIQAQWIDRIPELLHNTQTTLVGSNPSDLPGLALLAYWANSSIRQKSIVPIRLVDLGSIPEALPEYDGAIAFYNVTSESTPQRVELARDMLYRYNNCHTIMCVSGVYDLCSWANDTLRFYKFAHMFSPAGDFGIAG